MTDCGDNSCRYAPPNSRGGMRTNGGCRCDDCPACGKQIRPPRPVQHRPWCPTPTWVPPHHAVASEAGDYEYPTAGERATE